MARNRTFTGGKRSARTPSLDKNAYFQLARMIRNAGKEKKNGKNAKPEGSKLYAQQREY